MKMDWKAEKNGEMEVYDQGSYLVTVKEFEHITKNEKTFIKWDLIFNDGKYAGKKIVRFDTLTEKALWTLAKWVDACGVNTDNLPAMEVSSLDFHSVLEACINRTVIISVSIDETRGRNRVDDYTRDPAQKVLVLESGFNVDEDCPIV